MRAAKLGIAPNFSRKLPFLLHELSYKTDALLERADHPLGTNGRRGLLRRGRALNRGMA
jgi:hypothetical protein